MSQVDLGIAVPELLKLPDGASYGGRSGRASVQVRVRNDTVYVSATCDSLQRLVQYYEKKYKEAARKADTYRKAVIISSEQDSKRVAAPLMALTALTVPLLLMIGTAVLIKKRKYK